MLQRTILILSIPILSLAAVTMVVHGPEPAAASSAPTASPTPERDKCKPCRRPVTEGEVENRPADVVALDLDKSEVRIPCTGAEQVEPDATSVGIGTTVVDPENDLLVYSYTVSSGRIVGNGARVRWDLAKAQPGTYTISVGADDGCGVCGRTETKSLTVTACPVPAESPSFSR